MYPEIHATAHHVWVYLSFPWKWWWRRWLLLESWWMKDRMILSFWSLFQLESWWRGRENPFEFAFWSEWNQVTAWFNWWFAIMSFMIIFFFFSYPSPKHQYNVLIYGPWNHFPGPMITIIRPFYPRSGFQAWCSPPAELWFDFYSNQSPVRVPSKNCTAGIRILIMING